MPRIHIFWIILCLLRRHSRKVPSSRNATRPKLGTRYIILRQTWLAIIELPIAPQPDRHFQFQSPIRRRKKRPGNDLLEQTLSWLLQAPILASSLSTKTGNICRNLRHRSHGRTGERRLSVVYQRPGCRSIRSSPAAMITPVSACTLMGWSAMLLFEPPRSTLPPMPTRAAAMASTPT